MTMLLTLIVVFIILVMAFLVYAAHTQDQDEQDFYRNLYKDYYFQNAVKYCSERERNWVEINLGDVPYRENS